MAIPPIMFAMASSYGEILSEPTPLIKWVSDDMVLVKTLVPCSGKSKNPMFFSRIFP
jgi:hypothetical protein